MKLPRVGETQALKHIFPVWLAPLARPRSVHNLRMGKWHVVVLPVHATLRWKSSTFFYSRRFYFPVAMLQASSLPFSISPLRKNRVGREVGDPTHRRGECAVLQMHPNSLAAIYVCKGSTVGKFCQYSGYVRKVKGPDFISFLSLGVWFYIFSLFFFFSFGKSLPTLPHFK